MTAAGTRTASRNWDWYKKYSPKIPRISPCPWDPSEARRPNIGPPGSRTLLYQKSKNWFFGHFWVFFWQFFAHRFHKHHRILTNFAWHVATTLPVHLMKFEPKRATYGREIIRSVKVLKHHTFYSNPPENSKILKLDHFGKRLQFRKKWVCR